MIALIFDDQNPLTGEPAHLGSVSGWAKKPDLEIADKTSRLEIVCKPHAAALDELAAKASMSG